MAFEIAKAGWMLRESTILRRWKKCWVVLYQDGILKYFESPDSHTAEDVVNMGKDCISIKKGKEIVEGDTPPGHGRSCLLHLHFRKDKKWNFCAESTDDMSAWAMALEEAQRIPVPAAANTNYVHCSTYGSPYVGSTVVTVQQMPQGYGPHPPPYVVQGAPQQTVIYTHGNGCSPYYRRRRYDGTDVAMGAVAGAAVGTMMWGPLLWW